MCARRVEDLIVWQLANELRNQTHARISTLADKADLRFCSQVRDAASSVTRNIAEGFGRFKHKEFAQFLSIARGSVFELADHLKDGATRGYWSAESTKETTDLCNRTIAGLTHFIKYLKNHPDI